ncbi:MAG: hypothetical protein Q7S52_05565 [bacterium]|nr:hypothetical protein [bacterium]
METGPLLTPQERAQAESEKLLRQWFYVGQSVTSPDTGSKAVVTGFGKKYIQRGGSDHKHAGIYFDFTKVLLAVGPDGREQILDAGGYISSYSSALTIPHDTEKIREKMRALKIRIGDLPDTPFWVGDVVNIKGFGVVGHRCIVTRIEYDMPNYGTSYKVADKQAEIDIGANGLILLERGNTWKLEHGKPLFFPDETEEKPLMAEAAFYKSLGMSSKFSLCGGGSQHERHTYSAALQAIRSEAAHEMIYSEHKDTDPEYRFLLIRYDVPQNNFAARMQAYTLKRWTA